MDHIRILQRSFEIVRRYKILWIFGILLALTMPRTQNPQLQYLFDADSFRDNNQIPFPRDFPDWRNIPDWRFTPEVGNTIIGVVIGIICLSLLLAVLFTILRYVVVTAAIRMVDSYEASGEKVGFRAGWRMGWSRAAWRIFLVDLLFGVAGFFLFLLMMALAASPLLMWITNSEALRVIGTVSAVGLFLISILILVILSAGLYLLSQFFHRAVAMENLGVFDAIGRGWNIVRRRLGDVIILALLLFGLGLLFSILMIPIGIVLTLVGAAVGGIPGMTIGLIIRQFVETDFQAVLPALLVGLPIFLLIVSLPLLFIGGLFEVFTSGSWTLAYRDLMARE